MLNKFSVPRGVAWLFPVASVAVGIALAFVPGAGDQSPVAPRAANTAAAPALKLAMEGPDTTRWMILPPDGFYESVGDLPLRDESFAWPRNFGANFAPGAAVADFNADGRDDAAEVVWDPDARRVRIVAWLAGDTSTTARELLSIAAPPDSADRPELRTLYWDGKEPRTQFALSLTDGRRPSIRWLPASCEGTGFQWTWRWGRFWRRPIRCSLPEESGAEARRRRALQAMGILNSLSVSSAEAGSRMDEAEHLLEAALHPAVESMQSGTGARATADALIMTRSLQAMRHFTTGNLDSSMAAAGRWRALAKRVKDKQQEQSARAFLAQLYAVVGRPEIVEEYGRGLELDSSDPSSRSRASGLRYYASALADGLTHRGETVASNRIRALFHLDSAAGSGMRSWSRSKIATPSARAVADTSLAGTIETFGRALGSSGDAGVAAYHALTASDTRENLLFRANALAAIGDRFFYDAVQEYETGPGARAQNVARLMKAAAFYDSATSMARLVASRIKSDVNASAYTDTWMPLESRWILSLLAGGRLHAAAAASERLRNLRLQAGRFGGDFAAREPESLDLAGETMLQSVTPGGGSSLVYLPLPQGIAVVATRQSRGLSPVQHVIEDPGQRAYRLIPAVRLLVQQEGGVQARHGSARLEPVPADVAALVDSFSTRGGAREALAQLADLLLPEAVLAAIEPQGELVIAGPGPIGSVPFSALLTRKRTGERAPLVERYAVRMTPTLRLADFGYMLSPMSDGPRTALVLGDPKAATPWWRRVFRRRHANTPELVPLPSSADEARAVATLLGSSAATGPHATESLVRRNWGTRDVLHIASHAFVYTRRGASGQSNVVLASDDRDDGLLHARELLGSPTSELSEFTNMPGRTELVVLSACESGLGETRWSEGVMGFQRAFLAAGAQSVMTSLWAVRDDGTKLLMTSFYTHWLRDPDGPNKAEALRRAQVDVRKIPGYEAPYHWAGFLLAGAP